MVTRVNFIKIGHSISYLAPVWIIQKRKINSQKIDDCKSEIFEKVTEGGTQSLRDIIDQA